MESHDISSPNYRNEIFPHGIDDEWEEFVDHSDGERFFPYFFYVKNAFFNKIVFIIERYINWAKFPTTPYWDKLWGRIPGSLDQGTYYVQIENSI